jgi:cell wall-associated NlpC family hydrolase
VDIEISTQHGPARRAAARSVCRAVAVLVAATVCLVAAPAVAVAVPTPSDTEIGAAQQAQDAAAERVGVLAAQLAGAQAQLDAARAASAIALDGFQATQAEYETARALADAATAEARRADAALADSRAQVAHFARSSYVQGSTSPGMSAVLGAGGPAEMLERVALLDAAGRHEVDVLAQVTVAQQEAAAADAAARTALAAADALQQEAAAALAAAADLEAGARSQAAALAVQQEAVQAELAQAQQTLLGLEGARTAARQQAEQQEAEQQAAETATAQRLPEETRTPAATAPAPAAAGVRPTPAGAGSASAAQTAIDAAMRWIGTRYAWGGGSLSGPSLGWGIDDGVVGFDCSGLTRHAYAQAGISIPRNSRAQYAALPKVSRSALQAGDLVFWATDTGNPATIHHVAIYLGGDRMLEAPQSGSTVRVTSMRWSGYIGAVRPSA